MTHWSQFSGLKSKGIPKVTILLRKLESPDITENIDSCLSDASTTSRTYNFSLEELNLGSICRMIETLEPVQ